MEPRDFGKGMDNRMADYERELALLEVEEGRLFREMRSAGDAVDRIMDELEKLSPRVRDTDENYDKLDAAFKIRDESEDGWREIAGKIRELAGSKDF